MLYLVIYLASAYSTKDSKVLHHVLSKETLCSVQDGTFLATLLLWRSHMLFLLRGVSKVYPEKLRKKCENAEIMEYELIVT
jgi:hypothetical protein